MGGGAGAAVRPAQAVRAARRRARDRPFTTDRGVRSATASSSSCRRPTPNSEGARGRWRHAERSVRAGLAAVPADADVICVHDAARPLRRRGAVPTRDRRGRAPAPTVPCRACRSTDTIKVVDATASVVDTPGPCARSSPCRRRRRSGPTALAGRARRRRPTAPTTRRWSRPPAARVVVVAGEATNRKITDPDDLDRGPHVAGRTRHRATGTTRERVSRR